MFIDTNVLIYPYDRSEPEKQRQALTVLDRLSTTGAGVISIQVLGEFFDVSRRRLNVGLSLAEASELVTEFMQSFEVVDLASVVFLDTVRGVRDHQLNYWDALIWATARLNQVFVIFSEDFSSNVLEGVRMVNPFAPDFDLAEWV